jgi:hypothetical protein
MRIGFANFACPQVLERLRIHLAGMHAYSRLGSVFAIDLTGLPRPDVALYATCRGHTLVGRGASKEVPPDRARSSRRGLTRAICAKAAPRASSIIRSKNAAASTIGCASKPA